MALRRVDSAMVRRRGGEMPPAEPGSPAAGRVPRVAFSRHACNTVNTSEPGPDGRHLITRPRTTSWDGVRRRREPRQGFCYRPGGTASRPRRTPEVGYYEHANLEVVEGVASLPARFSG